MITQSIPFQLSTVLQSIPTGWWDNTGQPFKSHNPKKRKTSLITAILGYLPDTCNDNTKYNSKTILPEQYIGSLVAHCYKVVPSSNQN